MSTHDFDLADYAEGSEAESERALRVLRAQILTGSREPGSKLVERETAVELGISRIPIREAIKQLAAEGLVVQQPRMPAVVRQFTSRDVAELNEVRAVVERQAFLLAARRWEPEGLQELEAVLNRQAMAAEHGDNVDAQLASADFHEAVVYLAGNDLLMEMYGTISSRLRWLMTRRTYSPDVTNEHRKLFDAIAARDLELLERLATVHLKWKPEVLEPTEDF
ncbi:MULTISPECIES: GntR family transcriptional regulator [Arthrobacter]|uniref:GntR family transcriptional regulator n=2 Tax=Arthrobacter TaxID=1663 RepID=A0ABU9KNV6_9MICC|nr:GntR family transcriptional regulator [Arthrobacter sp. YJM1]MDP5228216.1 GntR family transcriptional regulator [Arthrobacter sp. YJM1]